MKIARSCYSRKITIIVICVILLGVLSQIRYGHSWISQDILCGTIEFVKMPEESFCMLASQMSPSAKSFWTLA